MFETLFQYPRVLARHRDGPSAPEREHYLTHFASAGATRLCVARESPYRARIGTKMGGPVNQRSGPPRRAEGRAMVPRDATPAADPRAAPSA